MGYVVSNFMFNGAKQFGNVYYQGSSIKVINNTLIVSQSSDYREYDTFSDKIANCAISEPIISEDFYFLAKYSIYMDALIMQTDIVGYESPFYYFDDKHSIIADNILNIISLLKEQNVIISVDEQHLREYLLYTECFFDETIFSDIKRVPAASIIEYEVSKGRVKSRKVYDIFKMTAKYKSPGECADHVFDALDGYFADHYLENTKFAIGMSGGLDSRVGAWFAKKYKYTVAPIFIGKKKNRLGIMTYDIKRANEVKKSLEYPEIEYIDPSKYPFEGKLSYDAINAPTIVDNISQNTGRLDKYDVIIHAMMGGEAFGALCSADIQNYSDNELACFVMNRISNYPKYKYNYMALKILAKVFPFTKRMIMFSEDDNPATTELVNKSQQENLHKRVLNWIKEQKKNGLDNLNICHKFFYYNFAIICKYGYYSTCNNTMPSLATYMNPVFIREILNWDSKFLVGKPIQKALISKLGNLNTIRSQTTECKISDRPRRTKEFFYKCERIIRGSGMKYLDFVSPKTIHNYYQQYIKGSTIASKIQLRNRCWLYEKPHVTLGMLKVLYIEHNYLK